MPDINKEKNNSSNSDEHEGKGKAEAEKKPKKEFEPTQVFRFTKDVHLDKTQSVAVEESDPEVAFFYAKAGWTTQWQKIANIENIENYVEQEA